MLFFETLTETSMHYYQHNIGDYARDTGHLSVLEHGIYRLILDWCYLNEKPITTEQAMRVGRGNPTETQSVLSEFFSQTSDGWTHKRVVAEMQHYYQKTQRNRENGAKGGRPKPTNNPVGSQPDAKHNPNQEPITNNQTTDKSVVVAPPQAAAPTAIGSRLPTEWTLPEPWREWAEAERPGLNLAVVAASFKDFWIAKPGKDGRKSDWQATWRNWVRNQRQNTQQSGRSNTNRYAGAAAAIFEDATHV